MSFKPEVLAKYTAKAVTTSQKATFKDSMIGIIGVPGTGKSSLLATASKHFNGWPNKDFNKETREGLIFLSDLCVIAIDPGSADGYKSAGYDCHLIDYRAILREEKDPERALLIALELASQVVGVDIYGLDSISQFDDDELNYLVAHPELWVSEKSGKQDTREKWDLLKAAHGAVYNRYLLLSGVKIFVGHTKALFEDLTAKTADQKEMATRKEKVNLAGNASITLDVTGKSERVWIRLNSIQIGVRTKEDPRTKKLERVLETEFSSEVDLAVKNRFSNIIGKNPEFNLHKMIQAIRA